MYFLYIYPMKKGLKPSLIIIPRGKFSEKTFGDFVQFITVLQKIISNVDHDLTIKQTHEMVMLKTKRIKQFKGKQVEEFHQDVFDMVESSGTQFLISKN